VTDATPTERATLLERGSPIVLCPRSNEFIGATLPDLPAILSEGFEPALGTDSLASSESLDVLEEARALHTAFGEVPCAALFSMTTAWGAAAMRRPLLGAIAVGRAPGILLAPADDVQGDPVRWIVQTAPPRRWLVGPGADA
jgi:cytosine/adenosine deaminase-related metal-dependent hydrolase